MSNESVVIFLEYDGVLSEAGGHQAQVPASSRVRTASRKLAFGPVLGELMSPYLDNVEIVISDVSALRVPIEVLRGRLPTAIGARVIDSMYLPELTTSLWSDYFSALATRYACIRLWLDRKRPNVSTGWLALEQGHGIDSWPGPERRHAIWGSLGRPEIQAQLMEKLQMQIRELRQA